MAKPLKEETPRTRMKGKTWTSLWPLLLLIILQEATGVHGGPSVPNLYCTSDEDCASFGWTAPLPRCTEFMCSCPDDQCAIYTTTYNAYTYYCGPCGHLGSECNSTTQCDGNWLCRESFCECDKGTLTSGLCIYSMPVPTSVSSVVLIIILAGLLILQKLITSRKMFSNACDRCRCRRNSDDEETSEVGYNPQSNTKTAAYTITNSDFMATSDDPDLVWALELSRLLNMPDDSLRSSLTYSRTPLSPRFTLEGTPTTDNAPVTDEGFAGSPGVGDRYRSRRRQSSTLSSQPGPSGWRPNHNTWSSASSQPHHRSVSRSSASFSESSRPMGYSGSSHESPGAPVVSRTPSLSSATSSSTSPQSSSVPTASPSNSFYATNNVPMSSPSISPEEPSEVVSSSERPYPTEATAASTTSCSQTFNSASPDSISLHSISTDSSLVSAPLHDISSITPSASPTTQP